LNEVSGTNPLQLHLDNSSKHLDAAIADVLRKQLLTPHHAPMVGVTGVTFS
jgi:hypothetical protein